PSVSQLATDVQAAAQQDQSLPQSSVQLGSSIQISPSVQVRPLTTFQSKVVSLPYIIEAAPCEDINYFQGGAVSSGISTLPAQASSFQAAGRFRQAFGAATGAMGATTGAMSA
ncbi:hypothetical protein BGX33_001675, partial [Mortierella sp. NVP41]